ncbi:MAG: MBL fold metallo-hydrolase [bacterium]
MGHSSFVVKGSKVVYFDPYQIPDGAPPADIILITHSHYDHCDKEAVEKIIKAETEIIASADCARELDKEVIAIEPNGYKVVQGLTIKTIPAYNIDKDFHPKAKKWVGYIVEVDDTIYYHAGDTDLIPEMEKVKTNVALLPVGGTYTMSKEEAVAATKKISAEIVIPMHYGSIVGASSYGDAFVKLAGNKAVALPKTTRF